MAIWRMRTGCGITKATDTNSEYVILPAFQCNNGHANAPQCCVNTSTACLVLSWWGDFGVRWTYQGETWRNPQCIWKENGSQINGKEGRAVDSSGSEQGEVADSCDLGNELWSAINCRQCLASWAKLSGSRQGLCWPMDFVSDTLCYKKQQQSRSAHVDSVVRNSWTIHTYSLSTPHRMQCHFLFFNCFHRCQHVFHHAVYHGIFTVFTTWFTILLCYSVVVAQVYLWTLVLFWLVLQHAWDGFEEPGDFDCVDVVFHYQV